MWAQVRSIAQVAGVRVIRHAIHAASATLPPAVEPQLRYARPSRVVLAEDGNDHDRVREDRPNDRNNSAYNGE